MGESAVTADRSTRPTLFARMPFGFCIRIASDASSSTCRLTCPAAGVRNAARNSELVAEKNWFCGPGPLTYSFANDLRADLLVDAYCRRLAPAHADSVTEQRRNGSRGQRRDWPRVEADGSGSALEHARQPISTRMEVSAAPSNG